MGGEENFRTIMRRPPSQQVRARAFDGHFPSLEPAPPQLVAEKISNRTFIRSNGFDVDQTAGERKQVHAGKRNSRWSLVASRWRADSLQYLTTNDQRQPCSTKPPASARSYSSPPPDSWNPCTTPDCPVRPMSRWCAIRIRSMGGRCTTKSSSTP